MIYFLFILIFCLSLSEKSVHHFAVHPGDFWSVRKTPRLHLLLLKLRRFSSSHFWLKVFVQVFTVLTVVVYLIKNPVFPSDFAAPETSFWLRWIVVGLGFPLLFFLLDGLANWLTIGGSRNIFSKKIIAFFVEIHGWVGQIFFSKKILKEKIENAKIAGITESQSVTAAGLSEKKMLQGIVRFDETMVRQVMQPRTAVVALDFQSNFQEVLEKIRVTEYSRLPVFEEDLDNVLGILYVKDVVPHLEKPADFEWQKLARTTFLNVPESKHISEVLADFKTERMHLAIVIDEFGSCSGIVTMEDILEEITGEIRDEFDGAMDLPFLKLDDHQFIFEGKMMLDDVCRTVGIDPQIFESVRGDADTLAGLLLEITGDIPQKGQEIGWKSFHFTVLASNRRRIEQVKMVIG